VTQKFRADELGARQLRLMERASAFLRAESQRGIDVAIAPECYLNSWARVVGKARLRRLAGLPNSGIGLVVARLREAMLVAGQSGYEVFAGAERTEGFRRLAVSWCRSSDFSADGSYTDRYFRISSRSSPTTLWFVIALDQVVPEKVDSNIVIFGRKPGTRRIDLFYLLRSAVSVLKSKRSDVHGAAPLLSAAVSFADQVTEAVAERLKQGSFESVVMPYEAQPFQHAVCRAAKSQDGAIKTVGYVHSALPPLPTDLIYRAGAPDLLLVHGPGQVDMLAQNLGWPAGSLRAIASLRYRVGDLGTLDGFIFLPYHFESQLVIEKAFRDFLTASPPGSLPPLAVRNHPIMQGSRVHARLKLRMEASMASYSDRFAAGSRVQGVSVFIGATAAILEALEHGVDAIHICSQPLLESHTTAVWKGLSVERLGEHVFRYRLAVRGTYIELGDESDSIEACLGPQGEFSTPQ